MEAQLNALNFLFWNIRKKPIKQLIGEVALCVGADCVILCECSLDPAEVLASLNRDAPDYQHARGECEQIEFFTKFDPHFLRPTFENPRISIRRLRLPLREEILIASAHLPSRLYFSAESLAEECSVLATFIEKEEQAAGHKRTLLVGDLNVNPFEVGVVGAGGLHAIMSRGIAIKGSRTVQDREYHFFYNPMWSHFGDRENCPPGTYYYERGEAVNYFWNIYDQVLLRPDLLGGFAGDSLRVLTAVGPRKLIDASGRPDKVNASDHLPVVFSLKF